MRIEDLVGKLTISEDEETTLALVRCLHKRFQSGSVRKRMLLHGNPELLEALEVVLVGHRKGLHDVLGVFSELLSGDAGDESDNFDIQKNALLIMAHPLGFMEKFLECLEELSDNLIHHANQRTFACTGLIQLLPILSSLTQIKEAIQRLFMPDYDAWLNVPSRRNHPEDEISGIRPGSVEISSDYMSKSQTDMLHVQSSQFNLIDQSLEEGMIIWIYRRLSQSAKIRKPDLNTLNQSNRLPPGLDLTLLHTIRLFLSSLFIEDGVFAVLLKALEFLSSDAGASITEDLVQEKIDLCQHSAISKAKYVKGSIIIWIFQMAEKHAVFSRNVAAGDLKDGSSRLDLAALDQVSRIVALAANGNLEVPDNIQIFEKGLETIKILFRNTRLWSQLPVCLEILMTIEKPGDGMSSRISECVNCISQACISKLDAFQEASNEERTRRRPRSVCANYSKRLDKLDRNFSASSILVEKERFAALDWEELRCFVTNELGNLASKLMKLKLKVQGLRDDQMTKILDIFSKQLTGYLELAIELNPVSTMPIVLPPKQNLNVKMPKPPLPRDVYNLNLDEYLVEEDVFEGSPRADLFAVFDGHGSDGGKASHYVKSVFPKVLRSLRKDFDRDPVEAMKTAYQTVNSMLTDNSAIDTYMSGTTAVLLVCLPEEDRVIVANVGDSRVLLGKSATGPKGNCWEAVQLTTDHTCSNPTELDRVKSSGARIEQLQVGEAKDGPLRIFKGTLPYPGLVVTRSLGDAVAGRLGVLCEPEVAVINVRQEDRFFVLGTDGLWDGMETAEVVAVVGKCKSAQSASDLLIKKALAGMDERHLDDNITNVVVFID
ncbi:hypothetical protein HDU97_002049 [Phlyctochytrium planicorne]|nr:hypothetical protein HDU97_002049 [Phlyctochytrium planicorne]